MPQPNRKDPVAVSDPWALAPASSSRPIDLLSLVPLVAIIALVGMVWTLVWAVSRSDEAQERINLVKDALWVEQSLRFQLSVDEDLLVRLALDQSGSTAPSLLDARARAHLGANPEMLSIVWHDGNGEVTNALPGRGAATDQDLVNRILHLQSDPTRPTYGIIRNGGLVSLGQRLPDGRGVVVATISLQTMLERHLPWWIAEQYGVSVLSIGDQIMASREKLGPHPDSPTHTISFDPPLTGTYLRISSYQQPTGFRSVALFGAIVALAIFAILALLVLFRSAQRRRAIEMRLRGETAFRRSMEESLTVGLRAKDHDGRILFVNPAFCKMVGWDAETLIGHEPPMPYWDLSILSETQDRQAKLAAGGAVSQRFETRFVSRDGRELDVAVYEAPLIDARGVHRGWMGSVIDLTEAKRAERLARLQDAAMAHTGRLVTLGEMASTLAHELNQPLSAIASYSTGLSNLLERDEINVGVLKGATDKIAKQAGRAGLIIRRIQDLVKKRQPEFSTVRMEDVILETVALLKANAKEMRVQLETRLARVSAVAADRILMEQVLINLIRNGMEAMSETRSAGSVIIQLREEDDMVLIEVIDHGCGISSDLEGKLFDAFATTKPQGMGMGLKICRSIIELHRGHLSFVSTPSSTTIFRVSLPKLPTETDLSATRPE